MFLAGGARLRLSAEPPDAAAQRTRLEVCVRIVGLSGAGPELMRKRSSSNGIQLGAVRSASGVVGTWTGATHDDGNSSIYPFRVNYR
jgi:hypothetical protein